MQNRVIIFLLLLLTAHSTAQTPPWTGIVDTSRAVDWSHAGVLIRSSNQALCQWVGQYPDCVRGLPTNRTQCGATITPSGQQTNLDATTINARLQQCAATPNTYVLLGPGTFYVVNGISFGGTRDPANPKLVNYVTLRGSGPDQTTLKTLNGNATPCGPGATTICVWGNQEDPYGSAGYNAYGGACQWTGGYNRGATQLTLGTCVNIANSALAVGQHIILEQRTDDIGISSCSSSGTNATCVVSSGVLPPEFQIGKCVAVGQLAVGGVTDPGYGVFPTKPQRPASSQVCNAQISAVTANSFTYNLPTGSNLAPYTAPSICLAPVNNYSSQCPLASVDTGGEWVTAIRLATSTEYISGGRRCPDVRNPPNPACPAGDSSYRLQNQIVTVTAINGNQITIDTPLYGTNWRASQNPGIWWFSQNLPAQPYAGAMYHEGVALEDLTVDTFRDGGTSSNASTHWHACYNCWIRNVRFLGGSRDHVWLSEGTAHFTVRDSYFYGSKRGASLSYGVEYYLITADVLTENNIFVHLPVGPMMGGVNGSVVAYNYMIDDGYNNPLQWLIGMESSAHDINTAWNLLEANDSPTSNNDQIHGTNSLGVTMFRERERGQNMPVKTQSLTTIVNSSYNRGMNFVGNVLGTVGTQTGAANYEYQNTSLIGSGGSITCNACIYFLGQTVQSVTWLPDDTKVKQSIFRWGNWDSVTYSATQASGGDGVRWCGTGSETGCNVNTAGVGASEMPTAMLYIGGNAVPASHTLPVSFYLTGGQPSWFQTKWGTSVWPPIGPDVSNSGDPDTAGHTNPIPAKTVWLNAPIDPAYVEANTITSAVWGTMGSGGGNGVTLTGSFVSRMPATIRITGAVPAAYNGDYYAYSTNGMSPVGSPNVSSSTPGGSIGSVTSSTNPNGYLLVGLTRVRTTSPVGETELGGIARSSISSTCPTSGNCAVTIPVTSLCTNCTDNGNNCGPGSNSGTCTNSTQMGNAFNIYAAAQGNANPVVCLQNATPIPLPSANYVWSGPLVGFDANNNPTSACTPPPVATTLKATELQYMLPNGGVNPGPMTTLGTITSPTIQVFNADEYYYGATPPPSTGPNGITGHGQITGNGKIT